MKLNPPSQLRIALYVIIMLGTPIVAYLGVQGIIDSALIALWAALTSVVSLMAGLNVEPKT